MSKKHKDFVDPVPPVDTLIQKADKLTFEIMTTIDVENITPENNTDIIKAIKKAIDTNQKVIDQVCLSIGYLLIIAKKLLPHGTFGKWVTGNCPFSHRTANNLMSCYRMCLSHPELLVLPKSVIYLLATKKFPAKLMQLITDCAAGGYSIGRTEALQLQTRYLNGDLSLDSFDINYYLEKQNEAILLDACKVEWEQTIKMLEKKISRYNTLIKNQRSLANQKVNNEYTAYWERSISIFKKTSSDLDSLCDGIVPDYGNVFDINTKPKPKPKPKLKHRGSPPHAYDSCVIDESSLHAGHIPPEDLRINDISKWQSDQYWGRILCPDDLTPIKKRRRQL